MVIFGLHSSIFDFITFYVLYSYFHFKDAPFQSGWFVESVLTELFILFIIRTRKPFLKSRPGKWLLIIGVVAFLVTILLPVSPFAKSLGLTLAHTGEAVAIGLIILLYVITADLLKILFFKRYKLD